MMGQKEFVIKGGVLVTPHEMVHTDLLIRDGRIAAWLRPGEAPAGVEVLDVGGKYIMPGCVDGHTHMMDPGCTEQEEFVTGTQAAAVGGVTTVVDHHRTVPAVYSLDVLKEKIAYLEDKACVDFGLKAGISPTNLSELESMWKEGITGFKTFTCNLHGVKAMYSDVLLSAFREVERMGGTVLIHCEDEGILENNERRLKAEGRTDYLSQFEWRSKLAESVAVRTVVEIAKATGCRVNIAHVSQPELLELIYEARRQGYPIYAETCPHYLTLTLEDLKRQGPWVKFTPPMNTEEKRNELRRLFTAGYVTTIGSDHCPYPAKSKLPGEKNIWDAPNGIPGVETSLKLMLNGVSQGWTTLNRVVECMCENPAKLYGLYPQKGHLAPGADADLVVLDMERHEKACNAQILSKCGWTPYDGMELKGVPSQVFVRGVQVARDGKFLGLVGHGTFVRRQKPCL